MATIQFTIKMNVGVRQDEDAGVYVSHCPSLEIFSQGETEDEAVEAIKSAITLHLTTAFDFNRLDKVLRKAGFEKFSAGGEQDSSQGEDREFVAVHVKQDKQYRNVPITLPLTLLREPQYASAGQV